MSETFDLHSIQLNLVKSAFVEGKRSSNLEAQPAPWMLRGLMILEAGEELTVEKLIAIEKAGGTDHPDPWVG
jgi:hypothetical protein